MLKPRLKVLITKVEKLGIDTQPIRDLLSQGSVNLEYEAVVKNLENEVVKYAPNSQPHSVQLLLKRLRPRPQSSKFRPSDINLRTENYVVSQGNDGNVAKTQALILDQLKALNDRVSRLKGGVVEEEEDPNMPKFQDAFVNPIDEEEVKSVKGHVKIVPKKGKSMSDALKNLKQLRKK